MTNQVFLLLLVTAAFVNVVSAFFSTSPTSTTISTPKFGGVQMRASTRLFASKLVELTVDIPPSGSDLKAVMKIEPCLSVPSEIIEIRYKLPFNLNVEPKKNLAVCTKDGKGGEKVGDILRYTSQWTLGLPVGEGLAQSAASWSGGLKWQCSMFNVLAARDWRQVVEALQTNLPQRTDEVVLIFERALEEAPELK